MYTVGMTSTPRETRYWAKVDRRGDAECWPWIASTNPHGYGTFRGDGDQLAHRYGYRLAYGAIPAGMVVCHHCDNPPCQNPSHLFLGDQPANIADMDAKGRRRSHSMPGETNPRARFTDDQVAEMCAMYHAGMTHPQIADHFRSRQSVITKVLRTRGRLTGPQRRATGLSNPNGKLSPEDITEIRRAYSAHEASQAEIGRRFGVSQPTIGSIVRGETHKTNTSRRS